jgi:hypothetical protein
MIKRNFLRAATLVLLLPPLLANRTVPKWQATRNSSLPVTERCVGAELTRFGHVRVEHAQQPEAGKARLFLMRGSMGKLRTAATIYMDGEPGFSALWMDAESGKMGSNIWRHLKHRCRLR